MWVGLHMCIEPQSVIQKYYLRSQSESGARNAFGESLIGFSVVSRIIATCIPLTVLLWTFQLYFHYIEK